MGLISLSGWDLIIAAALVLLLAFFSYRLEFALEKQLLVAAVRTTIQLLLLGVVLKTLFSNANMIWMGLVFLIMLLAAGREVMVRQKHRFLGWWGFGLGAMAMFISSFSVTLLTLTVIIQAQPWYTPQYAIPLLGMLLGNTMTGVAVAMDRLTESARQQRRVIEARLLLGETWNQAIADIRRDSMRAGMIPIINAMAAAGIVSLPGMMTGQILAGTPPVEAVKYQILIMFLIASGTGFGTLAALWMASRRLFDPRQRLRIERLR